MKKLLSALCALSLVTLSFTGCASNAAPKGKADTEKTSFKEAIVQQLDHSSLDEIRLAMEQELDAKAAEKNITITYKEFNGQNDASVLNQIGAQVVSDGYDAILPIATLAATTMATATEETQTPVIYAAISDPASSELTGIANVTGTSDALNTQQIMDMLFAVQPEACCTPTAKSTPPPPLPRPRNTWMPRALPTLKRPATLPMRSSPLPVPW